ncbi:MAG: ParB/RepB/Spo0J family partition protein [Clostridia bacterium]|nr:ParB/RepB/Spo0J family partition protein [Clostridia bacterium]
MAKKGGLGRGLDSLFLDNSFDEVNKNAIEEIKLSLIDPKSNQPRKYFDNEALSQLADSIAAHGVLQPIIVREIASGRYQIIAGERRWRASKLAGKTDIPCIIVDKDDLKAAQIALVENIQRENLNPLEEALAYRALAKEYEMTQEELSAQVGKSRSAIANSLRLLDLPEEVLPLIAEGDLSAGHARTLLGLKDRALIASLAKKIVELGLSVREVEAEVKRLNKPPKQEEENEPKEIVNYAQELEEKIFRTLGRKAKIVTTGKKKSITLYYDDNMDLEVLLQLLCGKQFTDEL